MVLDEEHGQLEPVTRAGDEGGEPLDLLVAQPAGRLVEEEQPRLGGERTGQFDPLQRRVRQARGRVVG